MITKILILALIFSIGVLIIYNLWGKKSETYNNNDIVTVEDEQIDVEYNENYEYNNDYNDYNKPVVINVYLNKK